MNMRSAITLVLTVYCIRAYALEKVTYAFSQDPIDVVIPCHAKDALCLDYTIKSIKQYVQGVRRIIVISSEKFTDNAEWVDENIFPFNKESLAREIFKSAAVAHYQLTQPLSRMGWIYQQFVKLFAAYYVPDISSNVLVVDSDLIFLKPVVFLQSNGAGLYATRTACYRDYFEHLARLLPNLEVFDPYQSGIAHHMLLQRPVLDDLCDMIQKQHNLEPWVAIAHAIAVTDNTIPHLAMSEYEIYFNFAFLRTDQVAIRPLKWKDIKNSAASYESIMEQAIADGYDFVAVHVRPHQK
jgi:hypothetical protein